MPIRPGTVTRQSRPDYTCGSQGRPLDIPENGAKTCPGERLRTIDQDRQFARQSFKQFRVIALIVASQNSYTGTRRSRTFGTAAPCQVGMRFRPDRPACRRASEFVPLDTDATPF